jgi:hypothetical protein
MSSYWGKNELETTTQSPAYKPKGYDFKLTSSLRALVPNPLNVVCTTDQSEHDITLTQTQPKKSESNVIERTIPLLLSSESTAKTFLDSIVDISAYNPTNGNVVVIVEDLEPRTSYLRNSTNEWVSFVIPAGHHGPMQGLRLLRSQPFEDVKAKIKFAAVYADGLKTLGIDDKSESKVLEQGPLDRLWYVLGGFKDQIFKLVDEKTPELIPKLRDYMNDANPTKYVLPKELVEGLKKPEIRPY